MKKIAALFFVLAVTSTSFCWAGLLIEDAKITDLRVGPWNTDSFAVKTTGTGDACSSVWVVFSLANFASPESYDRAYSMALAAMSANKLILITGDPENCGSADSIGFID